MAQPTWAYRDPDQRYEWLPELDMPDPGRQRRLTVLLRWLLLIPQFIVLVFLGIGAFFVVIVGWFAALFTARLPEPVARYLTEFLGYDTRVRASAMLLVDRYPPFALVPREPYPVRIEVRPGELNRLAVFFRLILMIPVAIVQSLLLSGWYAVAFLIWLVCLVLGRMPRALFEASAAVLRFSMRFNAYALMLASAYPKGLFGDEPGRTPAPPAPATPPGAAPSATRPLVLSTAAQVLVVVFLLIGLASNVISDTVGTWGH
jgi:hypothetical protein